MQSKDLMCNIIGELKSGCRSSHDDPDGYDDEIDNMQDQIRSWFSSMNLKQNALYLMKG